MKKRDMQDKSRKKPMTPAERQRKHRAGIKTYLSSLTPEQKFRRDLEYFVRSYRYLHPGLSAGLILDSLHKYGMALVMEEYALKAGESEPFVLDFLRTEGVSGPYRQQYESELPATFVNQMVAQRRAETNKTP